MGSRADSQKALLVAPSTSILIARPEQEQRGTQVVPSFGVY